MTDPRRDLLPTHEAQHSFDVVLRGYDRSQVADTIERLEADFRIALADRDAAVGRSADLAEPAVGDARRDRVAAPQGRHRERAHLREHQRAHPAHAAARRGGGRGDPPGRRARRPGRPRADRRRGARPARAARRRPGRGRADARRGPPERRADRPEGPAPRRRARGQGPGAGGPARRRVPGAPGQGRGGLRHRPARPPRRGRPGRGGARARLHRRPPASGSPPPSSTPRSSSPRRRPRPRRSATSATSSPAACSRPASCSQTLPDLGDRPRPARSRAAASARPAAQPRRSSSRAVQPDRPAGSRRRRPVRAEGEAAAARQPHAAPRRPRARRPPPAQHRSSETTRQLPMPPRTGATATGSTADDAQGRADPGRSTSRSAERLTARREPGAHRGVRDLAGQDAAVPRRLRSPGAGGAQASREVPAPRRAFPPAPRGPSPRLPACPAPPPAPRRAGPGAVRCRRRDLAAWPAIAAGRPARRAAPCSGRPAPARARLAAEGFLLSRPRRTPGRARPLARRPRRPACRGLRHAHPRRSTGRHAGRGGARARPRRHGPAAARCSGAPRAGSGFGSPAAAAAVVLAGLPALLSAAALLDCPAQLAVPWLLLAAWLTARRPPSPVARASRCGRRVATLLAPDVLVLLVPARRPPWRTGVPRPGDAARAIGALLLVARPVLGTVLLLPRWDPGGGRTSAPGTLLRSAAGLPARRRPRRLGPRTGSAHRPSRWSPPPWTSCCRPGGLSALIVCLPLAAVLAVGGPGGRAGAPRARGGPAAGLDARPRRSRPPLVVAVVALVRAPAPALPGAGARPRPCRLGGRRPARRRRLVADRAAAGGTAPCRRRPGRGAPARDGAAGRPSRPAAHRRPGASPPDAGWCSPASTAGRTGLRSSSWTRHPGVPTTEELARRQSLATALLANPTTRPGAAPREVLAIRRRSTHGCCPCSPRWAPSSASGVQDLPPAPGEPDDGPPARRALVDRLGGGPLRPGAPATERLLAWLDAQLPPFAPDSVDVHRRGRAASTSGTCRPPTPWSRSAP